jgi:hypothetical protein
MPMLALMILPLHMLAAVAWIGFCVIVLVNAGKDGEKAFRPQMAAAVVAFLSGAYLWHFYYGARFGTPQMVLAVGVVAAIAAAGVQGMLVGKSRRGLHNGTMTEEAARPKIVLGHKIAVGLLAVTTVTMVLAHQL